MGTRFNIRKIKIFLLLAAMLLPAGVVFAENKTALPVISGELIRNSARITFEWPKTVPFTADAQGKKLTITFARKANPEFGRLVSSLYPYIVSAQRKGDEKTIILTMDKPYKIRTFIADNVSGIDIIDIDPQRRKTLIAGTSPAPQTGTKQYSALNPAAGKPQDFAALSPSASKPEVKESPAESPAAESPPAESPAAQAASPADVTPAAGKPSESPMESPSAATKPAESPAAVAESPTTTAAETSAAAKPPESPATATAETHKSTGPNDSAAAPVEEAQRRLDAQTNNGVIKLGISAAEDSAVLRFPLKERVATAVFIRNNTLWIVLGKTMALDLSDFDALNKTVIGKGELMQGGSTTVLRVPVDDNVFASVAKAENSFEWAVLLTLKKRPPAMPIKISVNTDPPAPPHVFIPTLESSDPVIVRDPLIGDEIIITPVYNTGEAIPFPREFIEFALLETAQGVAVRKKADNVGVVILRNGLRISMPQGATLTPGLPEVDSKTTTEALQSVPTLFPYDNWKAEANTPRRVQIRTLFHKIVESEDPEEANDARLRLAELYLSEGMANEALAMLDGIYRNSATYYRSGKLAALHGSANFLLYRFADAARDFAAVELNNNKETDYWRNMLADLLGNPGQYDYLEMNQDYISKYPPLFRQRLAIVAADRSIDAKEYNTAIKIFDTLHPEGQENLLTPINAYVNFLMAKIASETGQEKDALDTWDKLAEDYKHPFVQSRAEFSRIAWAMDHGTMRKDEIIDRLERLRLEWHGDSLELKVLSLLGELYSEKKDYVNAMRVWDGGVSSFPSTATAIEMSRRMGETFILMFNEGTADTLPTFDALSLYYQYRNYAPPGQTGREMLNRLADRLVSLDLLDQAATLLEHQMRTEAEKIQRSQMGVKVATINLLNHQPKKALKTLEDSVYGENPVLLRLLRNRLAAESLSELGQHDKALTILGQDDSPEAEMIRLDIFWQKKDWPKVVSTVESMLRDRKDAAAPITLNESQFILQLALAYIFQNDTTQIQYLRDYFGPLMANNPNKPVFDFITAPDITLTPTNFDDVIKYLTDTRSFIDHYKAHIKTSGLSSIIPKESPEEKAPAATQAAAKQ